MCLQASHLPCTSTLSPIRYTGGWLLWDSQIPMFFLPSFPPFLLMTKIDYHKWGASLVHLPVWGTARVWWEVEVTSSTPMKKTKCHPLNISEGLTIWCQTPGCLSLPLFGCFGSPDPSWVSIFSITLRSYNSTISNLLDLGKYARGQPAHPICCSTPRGWQAEILLSHLFQPLAMWLFGDQGQYCLLIQQVSLMVELPEQGRNYDWRPRREPAQGSVTSKGKGFGTR